MPCHGYDGLFGAHETQIMFYRYRTTRPTKILSLPGGGLELEPVAAGKTIGRYSVRNPRCSDFPAMRPAVNGWWFGYCDQTGRQGWFLDTDLARLAPGEGSATLNGPAGEDAEVGVDRCRRKRPSGCGKVSVSKPLRVVRAETLHIRYSPRGTSVHYLHRGDTVRLLVVNGPHSQAGVEVVQAQGPRKGFRGWVTQAYLEAP